ncbi:hypothetical protein PR048_024834 [Dryococelus australis]|uniref:DDE-1 domain-containing protein n=1 Tax=Dryococelus australis TaxID=614101 RepID=A0ABQ9GPN0_9NEOP|nr:hypothetical protein PR048_024834 [Dryococelus australis]
MDETGIQMVPEKLCRFASTKGTRDVNKAVVADKGQTISIAHALSATGHYTPPALIFERKRQNPALIHGAPPGSVSFVSDHGYITVSVFIEWLRHFKTNVIPTEEASIILILDNHVSRISLEAITFAKENNILLLSLPPHSSQMTQPLEKCLFKSLKAGYDDLCDQCIYKRATLGIAANAFRTCGIVPLNRCIFTDEDQNCGITFDEIHTEDMLVIHFSSGTAVDYPAQAPSDTIRLQSDVPSTSVHPAISIDDSSSDHSPTNRSAPNNIALLLEPLIAVTPQESATDPSTSKHPAPVHIILTSADSSYRSTVAANTEVEQKPNEPTHVSSAEIIPLPKIKVLRRRRKH